MSKDLHEAAKKLMAMRAAKATDGKGIKNNGQPGPSQPKSPVKSSAIKAEPKKASAPPIKKAAPQAAQPKNVDMASKKNVTEPVVAKKAPKAKAAKAPSADIPVEIPAEGPPPPNAAMRMGSDLERDLPKGGGNNVMRVAEDLGETSMPKSALRTAGADMAEGIGGRITGKSLGKAALAGGVTGIGLQALMEAVNAEDANPPMHDKAAMNVAGRQAMESGVAPRSQLQSSLPSQVKAPQVRRLQDDEYGVDGPSDQQRMEDGFAREMKKYPR